MKIIVLCLAGVVCALIFFKVLNDTNTIDVTHHSVGRTGGAVSWLHVAQISDLHVTGGAPVEAAVVRVVNAQDPDVLVLTGDMVGRRGKLAALDHFLGQLGTRSEKFAVLGNHEYWGRLDLGELRKIYARHHVRLLINEAVILERGGRSLLLAGLDDALAGYPDWGVAMGSYADWEGDILVLAHNPGTVKRFAPAHPHANGLVLSGHTHGGQIVLFGIPLDTSLWNTDCLAGWCPGGVWKQYVSRGVGTSIFPVRVGARPELAFFKWGA